MGDKIYDNLFQLIIEARAHIIKNDGKVISADEPRQLKVGWLCEKTNQQFLMRYVLALNSQSIHDIITADTIIIFRDLLRTGTGRSKIADFINMELDIEKELSNHINRIIKLKSFW